ncbi:CoA transferase [Streptomyces sp. NPDC101455]|uniref:CoA transferase n=1 Tax=Streptomyces sp. NPDC101455 TaxID=3366142 RepID=UPI0037F7FAA9
MTDWIAALRDAGVPCGPVNAIDDVLADPQFRPRGIFVHDPQRHADSTRRCRGSGRRVRRVR